MPRNPAGRRLAASLALLLCASAAFPSGPVPGYQTQEATASAEGGKLSATARAGVPVDCGKAWAVFTDFEGMARFLPGVESSHAEFSEPGKAVLTQRGTFRYGIFSKAYTSTRSVELAPPANVESQSLPSDEVPVWSSTSFAPTPGGCSVSYSTKVGIPRWMPAFVAVRFAKSMAEVQMEAMFAEIRRRYPAADPSDEPSPPPAAPVPALR